MDTLPPELAFVKDPEIPLEIKTVLVQKYYEDKQFISEQASKKRALDGATDLEKKKFWHNTPLVVTLVGTISIAATAVANYISSAQNSQNAEAQTRQNDENTRALEALKAQLGNDAKEREAKLQATKEEKEFSYKIIERELGKSTNTADRAKVLLFLVRAKVLSGLNEVALKEMAEADLGGDVKIGIPPSIGQGELPDYSLPVPPKDSNQTDAAQSLLALAVREIDKNVSERLSMDQIDEYWKAVKIDGATATNPNLPWSGVFLAWLLRESGNGDKLPLSAANMPVWNDAVSKKLTFLPGEKPPLPGDIVFVRRSLGPALPMSEIRSGKAQFAPSHTGIVYAVDAEIFSAIEANTGNAINLRSHKLNDDNIIGFVRLATSATNMVTDKAE